MTNLAIKCEKLEVPDWVYFVSCDWNYKILKERLHKSVFDSLNPFIIFPSSTGFGW